jgi:plasmid stabilization system protein ParE
MPSLRNWKKTAKEKNLRGKNILRKCKNGKTIFSTQTPARLQKKSECDLGVYFSQSAQNADKFERELYSELEKVTKNPYANPIQRNNKGEDSGFRYRVFKRNYKIIIKIAPPFVKFVKLFHSKQNPDKMWD